MDADRARLEPAAAPTGPLAPAKKSYNTFQIATIVHFLSSFSPLGAAPLGFEETGLAGAAKMQQIYTFVVISIFGFVCFRLLKVLPSFFKNLFNFFDKFLQVFCYFWRHNKNLMFFFVVNL